MSFQPSVRTLLTAVLLSLSLATAGLLSGAAWAQTAAPAAPAATEAKAVAAVAAPETVENPYGIDALWKQGDFVSKGTLIILVIMSMGSWYIGIVKLIEQSKLLNQAKDAREKF